MNTHNTREGERCIVEIPTYDDDGITMKDSDYWILCLKDKPCPIHDDTREGEEREVLDITNKILALIPHIDGFNHSSINHKVDDIIHQELQKAREEAKLEVFTEIIKYTASTVELNKIAKEAIFALTQPKLDQHNQ